MSDSRAEFAMRLFIERRRQAASLGYWFGAEQVARECVAEADELLAALEAPRGRIDCPKCGGELRHEEQPGDARIVCKPCNRWIDVSAVGRSERFAYARRLLQESEDK
jgi:peptide subunit release factor 1 (eRF1)